MLFFADWHQKSVTDCDRNKVEMIMLYPETLVKIGPVHSEIIGLQGDR